MTPSADSEPASTAPPCPCRCNTGAIARATYATARTACRIGRRRRVAFSCHSFVALAELLRTTDLIAVMPRRLAASEPGLVLAEPPVAILGFTALAVWHGRTYNDERHRWARALLFETCSEVNAQREELLRCRHDVS